MQDLSVPVWAVAAVAAGLLVVVIALVAYVARSRRRVAERLDAAHAEAEALRLQVEEIRRQLERPVVPAGSEYVITRLGDGDSVPAHPDDAAPAVPAPVFADILLRETVVQAASLAAGLRRALAPEVRHRIRFEMRREVKRARKQRRSDLRAARREREARQRAGIDLERSAEGSAA